MFTCPKCGSHSFRSSTLRDGSVERSCQGNVVSKANPKMPPEADFQRTYQTARACMFIFPASDDGLYGVSEEEARA
jgi:hypothetical protein